MRKTRMKSAYSPAPVDPADLAGGVQLKQGGTDEQEDGAVVSSAVRSGLLSDRAENGPDNARCDAG